jgi:hypothetical protein
MPIRQSLFGQMLRDPARQDFKEFYYFWFISLAISKEGNIIVHFQYLSGMPD